MTIHERRQSELRFGVPNLAKFLPTGSSQIQLPSYLSDRNELLDRYPKELSLLLDSYFEDSYRIAKKHGVGRGLSITNAGRFAMHLLRRATGQMRRSKVDVAFNSSRTRQLAKHCSNACKRIRKSEKTEEIALASCSDFARSKGIDAPIPGGPTRTIEGCLERLSSLTWWQRAIKRAYARESEGALREAGLVSKSTGLYVSNDAVELRMSNKARQREFCRFIEAVNDLGESFTLDQLIDSSVSSPRIRRSEMMARIAGLEADCRRDGMVADLYTLTTPSRCHCNLASGFKNPKFDGSTPRDGQHWLCQNWARVRANLKRKGLHVCGIRVAEPHHDGTPHWHLLLYCAQEDRDRIRAIIRDYMLRDQGDEPGASNKRIAITEIDYRRGSGVSYVAKYVSKNIDGFGIDSDHEAPCGTKASDAAVRVETWASLWGIRQFQFFGAAPVGVWREIRRLREPTEDWLEPVRQLVDKGDWAGFTQIVRGTATAASVAVVSLWRKWVDRPGEYGDPIGFKAVGVRNATEHIQTRERTWTFRFAVPLEFCQ